MFLVKYFKIIVTALLLTLVGGMEWFKVEQQAFNRENDGLTKMEKIKGVCWEGTRLSIEPKHMQSLENHHANWMSQTPFGWQNGHDNPEIIIQRRNRGMLGEREKGMANTAKIAREKGIKTLLKPHIWLSNANGKWRSDIKMNSPEEWAQWFEQYRAFILYYARLAEKYDFEGLCIGTELYITTTQHEQEWRNIISEIRKVYSGQLTYAANFHKEYEAIKFWDALDYIGVQAYFPLTNKENPTLKELRKGWIPHHRRLKQVHDKWQKPIVFTEIGYRSAKDAAIRPWEWEKRGPVAESEISTPTQGVCYEAMFKTFWKEEWLGGVFFWKWTPENYGVAIQTRRRRKPSPLSFTPKTEALEVIEKWFAK